jgi:hypothetical protein
MVEKNVTGGRAMNTQPKTKIYTLVLPILLAVACVRPVDALAHHGWGWATDEEFDITGQIVALRLGNPHGEITLNVGGETWIAEVGQPWRNARAGLTPELLTTGRTITIHGHRSAKPEEKLVKAERVVIEGRDYDLYPDRDS